MTSTFTLRSPCKCGQLDGYIVERGAQDVVVRCLTCDAYQYCVLERSAALLEEEAS